MSQFLTFVNILFITALALFLEFKFPPVHLAKAHGGRRILTVLTELKKFKIRTNKTKQTVRLVFFIVDLELLFLSKLAMLL